MTVRIVVFARYPTPGQAKTRLIPALGATAAADLHRRLVERTLAAVRASDLAFEVRTTGADPALFRDWLGPITAVDQGSGELGERLARAGPPYPTLFIGSDAPDLTPHQLRAAAGTLTDHKAVIGPAEDGGYWLLGLASALPSVFDDIGWGSDAVFAQTLARLRAADADPVRLPMLADLDRPGDLARWPELTA